MTELSNAARDALGQYRSGLEQPADDDAALLAQIEASIEEGYVPPVLAETPAPALPWGHRLRWAAVGAAAAAVVLGIGLSLSGVSLSGGDASSTPEAAGYNASSSSHEQQAQPAAASKPAAPRPAAPNPAPSDPPTQTEPVPAEPVSPVPTEAAKADPRPRRSSPPTPSSSTTAPSTPAPAPDGLAEELRLMQRSRRAIDSGAPKTALDILAEHRRRFPRGQLKEDRMALRVVALCASGNDAAGSREAEAFARAFPKSHHLGRVRSSCKK